MEGRKENCFLILGLETPIPKKCHKFYVLYNTEQLFYELELDMR